MPDEASRPLVKIPLEPGAEPQPGKISELILEFASPLLELDPKGPLNIAALRSIMRLAEMAWNLPVLERAEDPTYASAKRSFDEALAAMPAIVARVLRQLVDDRKGRFAANPFFVTVEVKGANLDDARVAAEARMPASGSAR
jgi:hypothetical protein